MRGSPVERTFETSEVRLTYFEWGDAAGPPVVLVHATGMHARVWDQTVRALPEGYRVLAVDQRGHGRSEKKGCLLDWRIMAHDLAELVEGLGLRNVIGVGHSMGGHCMTQVAARLPDVFQRLLLIDPVMLSPEEYGGDRYRDLPGPEAHPVARRRNQWASWQELADHLRGRHPFSLWLPDVLDDYCRYGLVPHADGEHFELACPPAIEASVYLGSVDANIYHLTSQVDVPVVVLRAKGREPGGKQIMDFATSPTWEGVAAQFARGRDVYLEHLTHFIPMQAPELVARFINEESATP